MVDKKRLFRRGFLNGNMTDSAFNPRLQFHSNINIIFSLPSLSEMTSVPFCSSSVKWLVWVSIRLISCVQNQNSSIWHHRSSAARSEWFCWYRKSEFSNYFERYNLLIIFSFFLLNFFSFEGADLYCFPIKKTTKQQKNLWKTKILDKWKQLSLTQFPLILTSSSYNIVYYVAFWDEINDPTEFHIYLFIYFNTI